MAATFNLEVYRQELEELKKLPHLKDDEVWQCAVSSLSVRSALRVLPLLTLRGNFIHWGKDAKLENLDAIRAALSVAFIRSVQTERTFATDRAGAAASAAARSTYVGRFIHDTDAGGHAFLHVSASASASARTAYVASIGSAASSAASRSNYAARSASLSYRKSYAKSDKILDELVGNSRNDLDLLKHGKSELSDVALWNDKGVMVLDSEIMNQWRNALIQIGNEDIALWYDRFLDGNQDKQSTLNWLNQWLSKRGEEQISAISLKPKAEITKKISPAGVSDRATSDDKLGMKPYVEGLAQFLTNPETKAPLTVSVEGNWGIGKTSFLKILKGQLANRKVVWFNPWRHDEGEGLWSAFIVNFVDKMEEGMSWREKVIVRWKFWEKALGWKLFGLGLYFLCGILFTVVSYLVQFDVSADNVSWLKEINRCLSLDWVTGLISLGSVGWLLSLIPVLPLVQKGFKKFRQSLKSEVSQVWTIKDAVAKVTAAEKFSKRFRQFLKIYGKPDKPVFVIIDDLDRCAAPKAAELLDSLQLLIAGNGDEEKSFPVIFLLGVDREKVAAGVAVKYEAMLPYVGNGLSKCYKERLDAGREFGYEYLQKFIDVPFRLPVLTDENMEGFINDLAKGQNKQTVVEEIDTPDALEVQKDGLMFDDIGVFPQENPTSEEGMKDESVTQDSEQEQQKVQEIIERIDLKSTLLMSVPLLGHNPRRIKQYRNLLTLRTYLANANKLFEENLTVAVLAKVVVIELARPALYRSMCESSNIAESVSQFIKDEGGDADQLIAELSPVDRKWLKTHAETLRTNLDGKPAVFPTGAELSGVLSMSAPPSKVEVEVMNDQIAEES